MKKGFKMLICVMLMGVFMAAASVTVSAGNLQSLQPWKKVVMKNPGFITVKATDKQFQDVQLKKANYYYNCYSLRSGNSYTVRWAVPKGTYIVYGEKRNDKFNLSVRTSKFSAMKSNQTINWKEKATPWGGFTESAINICCYSYKPSKTGYMTFTTNAGMSINLFDKNYKQIAATSTTRDGGTAYLAMEKGKQYYLYFCGYGTTKCKVKCQFKQAKNQGGASKAKASLLKNETKTGLFFGKKASAHWYRYIVTAEDERLRRPTFCVDARVSQYLTFSISYYLNGKLIMKERPGSSNLQYCDAVMKKNDVLMIKVEIGKTPDSSCYGCGYYTIKKNTY